MAASELARVCREGAGPRQFDLDHCVHCGLCLNACPTYRELGLEADSPRGRIYQMVQVAQGAAPITDAYLEHIGLCLACRSCESACPSGVPYGRLIEAARAEIEAKTEKPWPVRALRGFLLNRVLQSRALLSMAGRVLHLYRISGMQKMLRSSGVLKELGPLGAIEALSPSTEPPYFFREIGKTHPAIGPRRYRVGFLAGCIANVAFARLNEATVRVLCRNGCDVVIPAAQGCCGALHVHMGLREEARALARRNVDAFLAEPLDAIITNAAGCGSTLKEYGELLADDPAWSERAARFSALMKDVNEFLGSIELDRHLGAVPWTVTYQDSCHLAHGQRVRSAPRKLLESVPGLRFVEMPFSDLCCGSAGIYNVVHREMADAVLRTKMETINGTGAAVIATANPGCMIQLRAGAEQYGTGQRVMHVVEILDEAYRAFPG